MLDKINIKVSSRTLLIAFGIIAFVLSCFLNFVINDSDTYAITSANVKTDFGAVGDGVADDTVAILNAFASAYDEIVFPEGEYLYTRQLTFGTGNKTIIGQNATLFTDDTYTYTAGQEYENTWSVRIVNKNNITFNGIQFESRQMVNKLVFKMMVGVMNAQNIHFDNCTFITVPENSIEMMSPVDFYANWQNVSVTNSRSYMLHSGYDAIGESGGSFMFRSFWGDCEDAVFANNVVEKNNHDEILWVAINVTDIIIDGMEVYGNRFYVSEAATEDNILSHTISFWTENNAKIKNVDFYDNELIARGNGRMLGFMGMENAYFYDNDIYNKIDPGSSSEIINSFNSDTRPNTPGTVVVSNNRTIAVDGARLYYFTTGANPYSFTDNDNIILNVDNVDYIVNNNGGFTNNNVVVNGNAYRSDGGGIISTSSSLVQNNEITVNGWADVVIRHLSASNAAMPRDRSIIDNTIIIKEKRPLTTPTDVYSQLIMMNLFSMEGKTITIKGNTIINGYDVEMDDTNPPLYTWASSGDNIVTDNTPSNRATNWLWFININDSVPADQTLIFCQNTIKGFRTRGGNKSSTVTLTCP